MPRPINLKHYNIVVYLVCSPWRYLARPTSNTRHSLSSLPSCTFTTSQQPCVTSKDFLIESRPTKINAGLILRSSCFKQSKQNIEFYPLSDEKNTKVSLSMLASLRACMTCPTPQSSSARASPNAPRRVVLEKSFPANCGLWVC